MVNRYCLRRPQKCVAHKKHHQAKTKVRRASTCLLSRINITIISAGDKKSLAGDTLFQTLNQYSDKKKLEEKPNYICCDTLSAFSPCGGTSRLNYNSN